MPDKEPTRKEIQAMIEKSIAEEFAKNDDIVEYVQDDSLESLKMKYASVEEDENIRNESFLSEPIKRGMIRKSRPNETVSPSDIIPKINEIEDTKSSLTDTFGTEDSVFDSDAVSFSAIDLGDTSGAEEPKYEEIEAVEEEKKEEKIEEVPEKPVKRKRGRPRKNPLPVEEEKPKAEDKPKETEKPEKKEPEKSVKSESTDNMPEVVYVKARSDGFDTSTKVIFIDESIEKGVKENAEDDVSNVFAQTGKKRGLFRRKRK